MTPLLVSEHYVALIFMVLVTLVTGAVHVQGRNSTTWLPMVKSGT